MLRVKTNDNHDTWEQSANNTFRPRGNVATLPYYAPLNEELRRVPAIIINLGTKLKLVVRFMRRPSGEGREHGNRFMAASARFRDEEKRKFFDLTRNRIPVQ
jgi:hypothetical protein